MLFLMYDANTDTEKTSLPVLKNNLLEYTEYHHTSLRYNITNFYGVIHIKTQKQERMLMQQMEKAQKDYSKMIAEKKAAPKALKSPPPTILSCEISTF